MKSIYDKIYKFAYFLELIVSVFVVIGILIGFTSIGEGLIDLWDNNGISSLQDFLIIVFDVVIGIEFLKMLCKHDLTAVIDVLLFATARQMIVEHLGIWEALVGVIAIGVLFAIRKYLNDDK